ncbi:beta-propeller domain-containing protein [Cognatilysobacter segetis]|uniref:beta-propeller domain-containing protein n=1 Tax=Cognatilysobacter segetis TaxID=2492394 RepID=UPI00105C3C93|nr:beta-propeller domain-containing protein [Lysobacter segetis]
MAAFLLRTPVLALAAVLAASPAPASTLAPFRSEAQLARTLDAWQARERASLQRQRRAMAKLATAMPYPAPPPAPVMAAPAAEALQMADSGAAQSITNNQVQGVDEGDIVKRRGDYLIVLRRGRLFTVRVGGDHLAPVAAVDAFGPDIDPSGTWYDEMLVSDDTVAVIGYSYARGGTEVGVFDLDARGGLRYRATYQLRSNDYYSSRNYASRLVGRTLVFYSPSDIDGADSAGWRASLPAYRRWQRGADTTSFKRMLPASRIYRGLDALPDRLTLHTVSVCDLAAPSMRCEATAVLGGAGGVFHVAEDAVYVWTTGTANARGTPAASVLRLPLDGRAPSMLRAWGSPIDQMGFLQKDGWLNVLVAREGDGDRMWRSGATTGDVALMRVPLSAFGGLDAQASRRDFRVLPGVKGYQWQQRFVGDWLVYGDGAAEGRPVAHALRYASPAPVRTLALPHALERIEALGGDGLLVGSAGADLGFTPLGLRGPHASLGTTYRQRDARQGDARTHGFFYRAQDADAGLLGLPVLRGDEGASVLYLRNRSLALSPLGRLDARRGSNDDGCRASCVDWYGNARPIFLGDRVFALMGYELVEGTLAGGAIRERRRVDFAPRARIAD